MNLPKISVITVVRNDVAHIEHTMLSVLGQTYSNVEYIVIDGGSTDGTVDIIKKYADRLAYWVSEPDGGIYPAMNKGLLHATGEWVNFMNSGDSFADDNVLNDIFGKQHTLSPSQHHILIGGNTVNFFPDGQEEIHHAESAETIPHHLPFSHQASFTKRYACKLDIRYKYAADYALFYAIFHKFGASSIKVIDRDIARYRQEESISMNPQNQKKIKREYLSIQSQHHSLHWLKEYLKWKLL